MFNLLLVAFTAYIGYLIYRKFNPYPTLPSQGKLILVSGCDTGFGNMLAKRLDKLGYKVLAGCLTDKGVSDLKASCSNSVVPFKLDVTNQEDIQSSVKLVQSHGGKLWGLVNNAGISMGSYVDWNTSREYERVMAINFHGHVNMSRLHLQSLVEAKGRIVNITSIAGILAPPGMSSYTSSKFALEAFSDSLRREVAGWGVKVSIVEPGFMNTPIVTGAVTGFDALWGTLSEEKKKRWGEDFFNARKITIGEIKDVSEDPAIVIEDLVHALTNLHPYLRYHPGRGGKILYLLAMLPAPWVDFFIALRDRNALPPKFVRDAALKR